MRDSQRSKVYQAERANYVGEKSNDPLVTLAEAQEWLDLLADHFEVGRVPIQRNARMQNFSGWYTRRGPVIEVPEEKVHLTTVAHEFAHHISIADPGHGPLYTERHLDVVLVLWGPGAVDILRESYATAGVKVGAEVLEEMERAAQERRDRRRAEHGKIRDLYVIRRTSDGFYLSDDGWYSPHLNRSTKVWKTERGAMKAAERYGDHAVEMVSGEYNYYHDMWELWRKEPV